VLVHDPRRRCLGTAHYSSTSQICLRMLSARAESIGREFFRRRLQEAEEYRRRIAAPGAGAYRVVFGEADWLPGLIVDRYGDYLVVQTLDQGMDRHQAEILDCLTEMYSPKGIVLRNDAPVRTKENLPLVAEVARGDVPARVSFPLNGFTMQADLLKGQKTGAYLDQRENYAAAAVYAKGRALDCFTSTGGFALHLAGSCETVEAVDSSAEALRMAAENAAANGVRNVEFKEADVFGLLSSPGFSHRRFETIVLDPPAFAKSRSTLQGAARGYKEINRRALELLSPGGILITCSCSHHVSEAMLLEIVAEAALDARRTVRVIERRTQSRDHPILLTVPETHYLKCLILEAR
jgi:23S rRNA (cytosine1962-C5)-methyltransferase